MNAERSHGDAEGLAALLDQEADPNSCAPDGGTPLGIAAEAGQLAAVEALLAGRADANARWTNETQHSPLTIAACAAAKRL